LVFNLQVAHDLSHITHARGDFLGAVASELGVDFTRQSDYTALNDVTHEVVHPVLDERGIQMGFLC
jgi:hypothetical protein